MTKYVQFVGTVVNGTCTNIYTALFLSGNHWKHPLQHFIRCKLPLIGGDNFVMSCWRTHQAGLTSRGLDHWPSVPQPSQAVMSFLIFSFILVVGIDCLSPNQRSISSHKVSNPYSDTFFTFFCRCYFSYTLQPLLPAADFWCVLYGEECLQLGEGRAQDLPSSKPWGPSVWATNWALSGTNTFVWSNIHYAIFPKYELFCVL